MGFEWLTHKDYKRHYICLDCKKGFKRPPLADMKEEELFELSASMEDFYAHSSSMDLLEYIANAAKSLKPVCPQCRAGLIQVPYTFEVPAKNKKSDWKNVAAHYKTKDTHGLYDLYYFWHLNALANTDAHSPLGMKLKANKGLLEKLLEKH